MCQRIKKSRINLEPCKAEDFVGLLQLPAVVQAPGHVGQRQHRVLRHPVKDREDGHPTATEAVITTRKDCS